MNDYTINGYKNEFAFAEYLNNKKIANLYPNYQDMIYKLYGKINDENIIKAYISYSKKKYDLIIHINGIKKRISIKKGINNSVHVESITTFIKFLRESNISENIIIRYLKYHYADGTINGSGKVRISTKEYKENHLDDIEKINNSINNPLIIKKAIKRFILQGINNNISIDGLIYGVVSDSLFITTEEIENIIMSKIGNNSSTVHFSCLFCQPLSRNLNYNSKYELSRHKIQIKWYTIFDNIIEYMNKMAKYDD